MAEAGHDVPSSGNADTTASSDKQESRAQSRRGKYRGRFNQQGRGGNQNKAVVRQEV